MPKEMIDEQEQFKHPLIRSSPRNSVRMPPGGQPMARGMSDSSFNFPLMQMQGANTTPNRV